MSDLFDSTANSIPEDIKAFIKKHPYIKGFEKEFNELVSMIQIEVYDKYQRRLDHHQKIEDTAQKERRNQNKKILRKIKQLEKQQSEAITEELVTATDKEIKKLEQEKTLAKRGNREQALPPFIAESLKSFWVHTLKKDYFFFDDYSREDNAKPFCDDFISTFLKGKKITGIQFNIEKIKDNKINKKDKK